MKNADVRKNKNNMIRIIEKNEIAKRKPYRYSDRVLEKIRRARQSKENRRKNMARTIIKINALASILEDDELANY